MQDLQPELQPFFSALVLYALKNKPTKSLILIRRKNSQIDT